MKKPKPRADKGIDSDSADESRVDQEPDEIGESTHLDSLRHDLEVKTEESRTSQDKYLRLAAEFENYKRRAQRDQADAIKFANEKLIKDLLPTLDNLERAIQSAEEQKAIGPLLEGVALTYKQLLESLTKIGLQQVSSLGEAFDPAKHQAVAQVESDSAPPNTVVEEYQKGYFLHDRIVRPAMVTVAKQSTEHETDIHSE
ncbi:MAG: nucleotide exchange factor GrpE [Nitrospirales bacterium]|nr:nucleotide exchange factor GrpE [Nitrospira sp.]MDR4502838.1 nucleotide exchange factor GrpE [Nitrospirales bacterium]